MVIPQGLLPAHLCLKHGAHTVSAASPPAGTSKLTELRAAAGRAAERRAAASSAAVAAPPGAVITDSAARTDAVKGPAEEDANAAHATFETGAAADGSGRLPDGLPAATIEPEAADDEAEEMLPQDGPSASQCPVCLEPMAAKVPHIYPCGHVFCRECSEKV